MLGPYPANLNDAEILRILLQNPNGSCKLLAVNNFVVLDRGFRDMEDELELKKINVLMPALKAKRKRLTRESRDLRYVTKIRCVVEAVYGILKQKYRLLDHKLDNKLFSNIRTYFRIASFLNNELENSLHSDTEFLSQLIERMKVRKDVNTLAVEAEEKGCFWKKLVFQIITSEDILDFPYMAERDLKILFSGIYQFSQAIYHICLESLMNMVRSDYNTLKNYLMY